MNMVLLLFVYGSFLVTAGIVEATICDVVPIEEWTGLASGLTVDLPMPLQLVVVTHTVTRKCNTDEQCVQIARAIRQTSIERGYSDIGLSFLVGGNGKIYEGAGWKVGHHTRDYNNVSISLSFIGNFGNELPSKKALDAARNFLGCSLNNGKLGCEYNLVGHRQCKHTLSPGDALQREIETWPHYYIFSFLNSL